MATNPLQQYFRQPKIYIKLPSQGIYNQLGTFQGDPTNMPVYGMTGMDEIIAKTPDALLSGESTVKVIASCCPSIKDPWEMCVLDTSIILTAIKIATYGNGMTVGHKCGNCGTDNEYELDLNKIIEYYMGLEYKNRVEVDDLIVKLQPLTYRLSNEFGIKNFKIQQQIGQTDSIEKEEERQAVMNRLFKEIADLQNEIYMNSVESVETPSSSVTEKEFIKEWLVNCDKTIYDKIKEASFKIRSEWDVPTFPVECDNCQTKVNLSVDLDPSSFFGQA
jgi:hypothetical protein